MNIEIINKRTIADLVRAVKDVPLLGDKNVKPYRDASVSLMRFSPEEVNPTTFYVLKKGIEFQRELREAMLAQHGIDTLELSYWLEISVNGGAPWGLTPPVVELTHRKVHYVAEDGGVDKRGAFEIKIPIINDGAHRVWLAREEKMWFAGLYISGADANHPFYAHPNNWSDVKEVDEVPKEKHLKKLYVKDDCYSLYRDFGVLGCGAPRGTSV